MFIMFPPLLSYSYQFRIVSPLDTLLLVTALRVNLFLFLLPRTEHVQLTALAFDIVVPKNKTTEQMFR